MSSCTLHNVLGQIVSEGVVDETRERGQGGEDHLVEDPRRHDGHGLLKEHDAVLVHAKAVHVSEAHVEDARARENRHWEDVQNHVDDVPSVRVAHQRQERGVHGGYRCGRSE